jgi:hypothetical protein
MVIWGKSAQVTNNPESDGCISVFLTGLAAVSSSKFLALWKTTNQKNYHYCDMSKYFQTIVHFCKELLIKLFFKKPKH